MSLIAELGPMLSRQEDPAWMSVSVGVTQAMAAVYDLERSRDDIYVAFLARWFLAAEEERLTLLDRNKELLTDDAFPGWLKDRFSTLVKLPPENAARRFHTEKAADLAASLTVAARSDPGMEASAAAATDSARIIASARDAAAQVDVPCLHYPILASMHLALTCPSRGEKQTSHGGRVSSGASRMVVREAYLEL